MTKIGFDSIVNVLCFESFLKPIFKSFCYDNIEECKFDYKGKEKALNGKSGLDDENLFTIKRIIVIQME